MTDGTTGPVRLLVVFTVAFSMVWLSGSLTTSVGFPGLSLVHAATAPGSCHIGGPLGPASECWYPAGPAMDTEQAIIFTDAVAEFADLQSPNPRIDLTDTPLSPDLIPPLEQSPNFFVTTSISLHRYYDIQFMLLNNFWGCNFSFGNSACGVQVRQGIAHMIDKAKFATSDPSIAGIATALDNPLPPNNGGLYPPDPCSWDANFTQVGPNCVVGAPGGTAYHLANATGVNGMPWLQSPGSMDLNAAAQHFVAAFASIGCTSVGFNSATSVLTNLSSCPAAASHVPNFFIRNDDPARLRVGDSLAEQICYLFTGSYNIPCPPYLTVTHGPISQFAGFTTCDSCSLLSWGIYTGAFSDVFPFDASLYYTYNSRFVSGIPSIQPPNGPCSASSVPSFIAPNYMYLCNPAYDNISSQMEFAPCFSTTGDPTPGQTTPTFANCPATTQLTSVSAGYKTEDAYGKGAYSIPIFDITGAQYAYLSNWQRVVNADGTGIPNFFTWLNAHSPNPAVPGTVRQGFSQTTSSVNPYVAETPHDTYVVRNIYDSLAIRNPLSQGQIIDWMAVSYIQTPLSSLTYPPPPGTVANFRVTLRPDIFFQDGRKVTSFDVAFSYLSMIAVGAFQGGDLAPITGITILGPTQFDININGVGPFTLNHLTSPAVLPARYWTNAGSSSWDSSIATCTAASAPCYAAQYTLNPATGLIACSLTCTFPASLMNVNVAQASASYDPIINHTLVGSGPFTCGVVTIAGSGSCSSSGAMNPPVGGSYSLTRFGKGLLPASSPSSIYFRSGGNLALWIWTLDNGDITHDFLNFSTIASCFGVSDPFSRPDCHHWMMGIGGCGATQTTGCTIGFQQIAIVSRYVGMNWLAPFNWQSMPPVGIAPFPPTLYDDGITLNPASVAGCSFPFPNQGYDC